MPITGSQPERTSEPGTNKTAKKTDEAGRSRVRPRGPIFVSYRQSDGKPLAVELAAALRAFGVPVWQDATDLPPGDTERRLSEAMASGLSGAILAVTPEISESSVVKNVELPTLLELEAEIDFIFLVANSITDEADPNRLSYEAPDRILGRSDGRLSGIKQFPVDGTRCHCLNRQGCVPPAHGLVAPSTQIEARSPHSNKTCPPRRS